MISNNINKIIKGTGLFLLQASFLTAQVISGDPSNSNSNEFVPSENSPATVNEVLPKISIDLVTVGDAGNAPSKPTERTSLKMGSVATPYQIGKYEVTASQYCAFLNAVATVDTFGLYDRRMSSDEMIACLSRITTPEGYYYEVKEGRGDFPITYVNWLDAARFCNWIHNGQPIGPQGPMTTERGAYTLDGATSFKIHLGKGGVDLNEGATCYLPTHDQWYKAAYYKGGGTHAGYWKYPTQSNTAPGNNVGEERNQANYKDSDRDELKIPALTPVNAFPNSQGTYGTYDMGGNVWEWTGTPNFSPGDWKLLIYPICGGSWDSVKNMDFIGLGIFYSIGNDDLRPDCSREVSCITKNNNLGFRIAAPIGVTLSP